MFIVHLSKNINLLNLVVTLFWTAVPLTDQCATVLQRAGCVAERMGRVLKMVVAILKIVLGSPKRNKRIGFYSQQ